MTGEILFATGLSLRVAIAATILAVLAGLPAGAWLAVARFPGRRGVVVVTNTLMAVPTVLIGLLVYGAFSRRGPLGPLDLLYTPVAMVIGEALLAWPLVTALARGAIEAVDPRAAETARTLGAGPWRTIGVLCGEARPAIAAAVLSAFGRVVSELGIALMVGGNVRGETRTLTTAMTLATERGDFSLAVGLGFVLLGVALAVALAAEVLKK